MLNYRQTIATMQEGRHLRHDVVHALVVVFANDEGKGLDRLAEATIEVGTLDRLVREQLIAKRPSASNIGPGFDYYDLTEAGRNYKP